MNCATAESEVVTSRIWGMPDTSDAGKYLKFAIEAPWAFKVTFLS